MIHQREVTLATLSPTVNQLIFYISTALAHTSHTLFMLWQWI